MSYFQVGMSCKRAGATVVYLLYAPLPGNRAQSFWHGAAFSISLVYVYEFTRIHVVMSRCLTTTNFVNPEEKTEPQFEQVTTSS